MSDEEFTSSIRKFLKHLGVTGHQLIEDELRKAVKHGEIETGSKVEVEAEIILKGTRVDGIYNLYPEKNK